MACTVQSEPRKPTVLFFFPWPSIARICASPFTDDGTFSDVRYQITAHADGALVIDSTLGFGAANFTVRGIALAAGSRYVTRIRYENEAGFSKWSDPFVSRVPIDLAFPALSVPEEPLIQEAPLTITPSLVQPYPDRRPARTHALETGGIHRRPRTTRARKGLPLTWLGLDASTKDTLVAFLRTSVRDRTAFRTAFDDPPGSPADVFPDDVAWFVIDGSIAVELDTAGLYTVRCELIDTRTTHAWTVGRSEVGGPDTIGGL